MSNRAPNNPKNGKPLTSDDHDKILNFIIAVGVIRGFTVTGNDYQKMEKKLIEDTQQGKFNEKEYESILRVAENVKKGERANKNELPDWIKPFVQNIGAKFKAALRQDADKGDEVVLSNTEKLQLLHARKIEQQRFEAERQRQIEREREEKRKAKANEAGPGEVADPRKYKPRQPEPPVQDTGANAQKPEKPDSGSTTRPRR